MASNEDTPPPPPENPKKRGKKPGYKIFKPSDTSTKRNYSTSVSTVFRERIDPNVLYEFLWGILEDKNPVIEKDGKGGHRVIQSLNGSTPTLQQKLDVIRTLMDRRDGMAPQSVHIEAMLRATIQPELPAGLLNALTPQALWHLQQAFQTPTALPESTDVTDVLDAEFTETPSPDKDKE